MKEHFSNQIYRQPDDGTGHPRYFYVAEMVKFAELHLPVDGIKADLTKAIGLVEAGIVDPSHLKNVDFTNFAPVVAALGVTAQNETLIIDGNHRYVAATISMSEQGIDEPIPAHLLDREHWERYIVPPHLVPLMGIRDHTGPQ
ncbi:hypothetical protein AAG596_14325 [Citromicrobium bathyomarinum]|uniref:hypothetical protein n=1 Tax=Citromicrobium bathyomarinum TaxID=72174 RepID=UPI003159A97B